MKRSIYFILHYLYFLLCLLLGVAGIYLAIRFSVEFTFPIFVGVTFILSGIVGLIFLTVELILHLKGEVTD